MLQAAFPHNSSNLRLSPKIERIPREERCMSILARPQDAVCGRQARPLDAVRRRHEARPHDAVCGRQWSAQYKLARPLNETLQPSAGLKISTFRQTQHTRAAEVSSRNSSNLEPPEGLKRYRLRRTQPAGGLQSYTLRQSWRTRTCLEVSPRNSSNFKPPEGSRVVRFDRVSTTIRLRSACSAN